MSFDALTALPLDTLKPAPTAPTTAQGAGTGTETAARARIDKTSKDFEASFLSIMFGQMFEGVSMGGGEGEGAFRSFLTEAMAKSMSHHGGIGLAGTVRTELLKLQGLT